MLPHQFQRLIETLHTRLSAIQEAFDNSTDTRAENQAADQEEKQNAVGALRSISNDIQASSKQAQTDNKQASGQQGRLIRLQRWLVIWAALAFFAAFGYAAVAAWQGCLMHRTYGEIQKQTREARKSAYAACLNAQASQATFLQIERSAGDSHAIAVASVQQATATIKSERADLVMYTRVPKDGEYISKKPAIPNSTDQLGIPITLKNEGKSIASNFTLGVRAVLLENGDQFVIRNTPVIFHGSLAPGSQLPGPADPDSQYKPIAMLVPVDDVYGMPVPYTSPSTWRFLAGNAEIMVYGILEYGDDWGHYKTTFCIPQFIMSPGTSRPPSTYNEIVCSSYHQDESEYTNLPKIQPPKPLDTRNIKLINCEVPQDEPEN
jgi:hypothetical protein